MRRRQRSVLNSHKYVRLGLSLIGITFFLLLTGLILFNVLLSPVNPLDKTIHTFVIEKGESVSSIATRLHSLGLIRSPLVFRLLLKKDQLATRLQAGTYSLSPSLSMSVLAKSLTKGFSDLRLTIPEGFRREQIASLLASTFSFSQTEFLENTQGKEGYLFPDTYFFSPSTDLQTVLDTFQSNFDEKVNRLSVTRNDVILASLVERETKTDTEKPLVAGILKKRLSAGWPLQLDATIQYFLGTPENWWPNTTLLDRNRPSPYNTYLHLGLPPGPICNPGLSSLRAVLDSVDSPYWFYLHDREGVIHYATTSAEHTNNIARFLR